MRNKLIATRLFDGFWEASVSTCFQETEDDDDKEDDEDDDEKEVCKADPPKRRTNSNDSRERDAMVV